MAFNPDNYINKNFDPDAFLKKGDGKKSALKSFAENQFKDIGDFGAAYPNEPASLKTALSDFVGSQILPGAYKTPVNRQEQYIRSANLPTIGSIGGGILGGIGGAIPTLGMGAPGAAILGAGVGGAGGKSLEQALLGLIGKNKNTLGQNLADVGKAGLAGAASEGIGQSIVPGLKALGQAPGIKQAGQYIAKKAGNITQSLGTSAFPQAPKEVAEAVSAGKQTIGEQAAYKGIYGFKRNVLGLLNSQKKNIGESLDVALESAKAEKIDPQIVVKELDTVKQKFLNLGNTESAKAVEKRAADWLGQFGSGLDEAGAPVTKYLTPSEANVLKRQFANQAKQAFKQADFTDTASLNAEFSEAMAKGLRKAIENVVPQAKILNKEYHLYDKLAESVSMTLARDLLRSGLPVSGQLAAAEAGAVAGFAGASPATGAIASVASRSFPVKTFLAAQLAKIAKSGVTPEVARDVTLNLMSHPTFKNLIYKTVSRGTIYKGVENNLDKNKKSE